MASKTPRHHKLFWGSSYDRGLDMLLFMWPELKREYPDAELHVCYGWNLFDVANSNNPERMQWKKSIEDMMRQDGIYHYGRVGQKKLQKIRKKCGIWAYPTYFREINCITALQSQADGLVPVAMSLAALNETVGTGSLVDGDIHQFDTQEAFKNELVKWMSDKNRWADESKKAKEFARKYTWDKIALEWVDVFNKPLTTPMVSVVTPTIRTGFWNVMANNLSKQTYKNFEWVIVDDYKEDRADIAKKYADKYKLNIRYIRGDRGLGKHDRKCGLVRANNIGWKAASGELLVWLQDFIIIPNDGIESLVNIYRHNPDAIIAPVDVYYNTIPANRDNKEDWWGGKTDVITEKSWTNPRVKNIGMRQTDNPFEYEANYGAIPKEILNRLNGWWEFFDDGLGFDNTEIALRALNAGYRIIVDDTNIAKCINIWPATKGTNENILNRERMLNPPRYVWFTEQMRNKKLPLVRDEKMDKNIKLDFEVPKDITDEECPKWIYDNTERIVQEWIKNN